MFPTIKAPIKSLLLTNKTSYCCSKISSTNSLLTTIRSKHSNRQIKRLFKQNPAFQRVSARNDTQPKKLITPPPPVTIDAIYQPNVVLSNGWSNPPLDEEIIRKRNEIPFAIKRTGGKPNGSVGFLPVYSNFRLGGSKQTTIVKKISGNKNAFLNELRAVLSISMDDQDAIRVRAAGDVVEVNGNRSREIKTWLASLGF